MWFAIESLSRSVIDGDTDARPLYERNLFLVSATSEERAREKGIKFAREKETSYLNMDKERVSWTFLKITDVQQISDDEIGDGVEVFYRFFKDEECTEAIDEDYLSEE